LLGGETLWLRDVRIDISKEGRIRLTRLPSDPERVWEEPLSIPEIDLPAFYSDSKNASDILGIFDETENLRSFTINPLSEEGYKDDKSNWVKLGMRVNLEGDIIINTDYPGEFDIRGTAVKQNRAQLHMRDVRIDIDRNGNMKVYPLAADAMYAGVKVPKQSIITGTVELEDDFDMVHQKISKVLHLPFHCAECLTQNMNPSLTGLMTLPGQCISVS